MKLDYATYLAKDAKRRQNFETFSPHEVCLDDQHLSLCGQAMYFSIYNNINSDVYFIS